MNIQNIPRKDKTIKRAVLPKTDALLLFDYSQIEYRLWAWYLAKQTDDWQGVEIFREGRDIHAETAKAMLTAIGREFHDPLTDEERQFGKTGNFAAIYSGGIPTIQRQTGCDKATARDLANAFHGRYPNLGRWEWKGRGFTDPDPDTLNGQLVSRLRERKYITTLWGRHLHPTEDRKALNALIQGGAADLMKAAMVRTYDWYEEQELESHMVLSVHDEISFDAVESEIPLLLENVPKLMTDEPMLTDVMPIEVDAKLSFTNWAEAQEVTFEPGRELYRVPQTVG